MTRFKNRVFAATVGLAACGVILTGCGTGQISQSAGQESAVNGNSANVQNVALRNVYLQASQNGDSLKSGRIVPLLFVAANNSLEAPDKLVSVTSDIATVALSGDTSIPVNGALVANAGGAPGETPGTVTPPTAAATLTQPITNGLGYKFTFNFEKAGSTTIIVPIAAPESAK